MLSTKISKLLDNDDGLLMLQIDGCGDGLVKYKFTKPCLHVMGQLCPKEGIKD